MKKLVTLTLAAALMLASGCAKPVPVSNWKAFSGSKSDAIVRVGCLYGAGEYPQESVKMQQEADQRCQSWGYERAEAFGFVQDKCNKMGRDPLFNNPICIQMIRWQEYQCIGQVK